VLGVKPAPVRNVTIERDEWVEKDSPVEKKVAAGSKGVLDEKKVAEGSTGVLV
jgi:hypothetical protein